MANFQPNWKLLQSKATNYINASILIPKIKSTTSSDEFVYSNLTGDLTTIIETATKEIKTLNGGLVIAVDTLTIAEGDTKISSLGIQIVARSIQVKNNGKANIIVSSNDNQGSVQVITSEVNGDLSFIFGNDGKPQQLNLDKKSPPQIITFSADPANPVTIVNDATSVADVFHSFSSVLSLELSFLAASVLVEDDNIEAKKFASKLLRWVNGACYALIEERTRFSNLDIDNIASLQTNCISLLAFTQAAVSNSIYVPALSDDFYSNQITALLSNAKTYDGKIQDFKNLRNIDELLKDFAGTLKNINTDAETPLFNTLERLAADSSAIQSQLSNAAIQLDDITKTFAPLQKAVREAIDDQFQRELLETAMKTLFTLATFYIGAAAAVVGDPELIAGESAAIAKAALDIAEKLASAGESIISGAINDGTNAATGPATIPGVGIVEHGGKTLMGAMVGFGEANAVLWAVVDRAIAGGQDKINFSPDLIKFMDKVPNLSGFSIGGISPTIYWETMVTQVKASMQPYIDGPITGGPVRAYIEAIELASTYGKSIGDQQMKLLEIYNQGITAFDQLVALDKAEAEWTALEGKIDKKEAKIDAAIGFLEKGYTNIKRNIVSAVNNYRAAFLYEWLEPSSVRADTSMEYTELEKVAQDSVTSLGKVLTNSPGGTIQPRQSFDKIFYTVKADKNPLFREVNGKGQANWSITLNDTILSGQLNGNKAFFITEATFELIGASQTEEVELQIKTSANYSNELNGKEYRFVSKGFSMSNNYRPTDPPTFITKWEFADQPNYITPSPYTEWELVVDKGNWKDVTSIKVTFSGLEIQNASNTKLASSYH